MFLTTNDTPSWAIAVDGFFGLFDDQIEALAVWSAIGGVQGSDGLAETAFGSAQILRPGESRKTDKANLSAYQPIDISNYVKRHKSRRPAYVSPATTPAQRLEWRRFFM